MPTDEILIRLFLIVDEKVKQGKPRKDAYLYPSEIVTIGLLYSLKGGHFRSFHRWLTANYGTWFPRLPERSRLLRLLRDYAELSEIFLADPSFFSVIDSFGIELIHPRREGRSDQQIGKKGISNGRWIVGIKLAWLISHRGEVISWAWDSADAPDNVFVDLAFPYKDKSIALADHGFRVRQAPPSNIKICKRGSWNERYTIGTNFAWSTNRFSSKKLYHRKQDHLWAHLSYMAALVNCLLQINDYKRSLLSFVI